MKKCNHCQTSLARDARFCHKCGAKVVLPTIICPDCRAINPANRRVCGSCGKHFSTGDLKNLSYQSIFPLDFKETSSLSPTLRKYFLEQLKKRVSEEQSSTNQEAYLRRFEESDFGKKFDLRIDQLAEEAYTIHAKQDGLVQRKVDELLTKNFNNLLDHFFILYCKDLNEIYLPENILTYHDLKQGEFDLQQMVLDFLDLETEKEPFYTDFILMPVSKLKNASQAFLFPKLDEKIMLIADQTIFGSCKEGFALTEKGIYWKAHFEKAKTVAYQDLRLVKKEKDWLSINGNFFNVNPSINLKMMKLLKKLMEVY